MSLSENLQFYVFSVFLVPSPGLSYFVLLANVRKMQKKVKCKHIMKGFIVFVEGDIKRCLQDEMVIRCSTNTFEKPCRASKEG